MAPEQGVSARFAANIVTVMADEPLEGGGITAVSRVDGTIRRSTGWWSDAVHALLGYLEVSKFTKGSQTVFA
jgi:hypothetical protein